VDAILTDSHTHLDDGRFDGDREQVIERARDAGVARIVTIGSLEGAEGAQKSVQIARDHDGIWATVGIHPHDARLADERAVAEIEALADGPEVVAVGETGLDYHYDFSPREDQRRAFRAFIAMARAHGKPLVIHSRESMQDTLRIMDEEEGWEAGGVFHCFSGSAADARTIIDHGFHVSFAGVVTFKKADRARALVASLPRDRLLVETDAPYLTPVPFRGKRNEPARVKLVAEKFAEIWSVSLEEAARTTSENASRLFGLD
jgi:TatD DNase family protein